MAKKSPPKKASPKKKPLPPWLNKGEEKLPKLDENGKPVKASPPFKKGKKKAPKKEK